MSAASWPIGGPVVSIGASAKNYHEIWRTIERAAGVSFSLRLRRRLDRAYTDYQVTARWARYGPRAKDIRGALNALRSSTDNALEAAAALQTALVKVQRTNATVRQRLHASLYPINRTGRIELAIALRWHLQPDTTLNQLLDSPTDNFGPVDEAVAAFLALDTETGQQQKFFDQLHETVATLRAAVTSRLRASESRGRRSSELGAFVEVTCRAMRAAGGQLKVGRRRDEGEGPLYDFVRALLENLPNDIRPSFHGHGIRLAIERALARLRDHQKHRPRAVGDP